MRRFRNTVRHRDESGGTVIIVALMVFFVLFAMSALVVDAGQAFANRRQLQNATDAAALAAIGVYKLESGDCEQLAADATLRAQAHAAAQELAGDNRNGFSELDFDVSCIKDGPYKGGLQATYAAGRSTKSYFQINFGDMEADSDSTAALFVNGVGERFRPYGLCIADVPPVSAMPSTIVEVKQPGQAHAGSGCVSAEAGGNWWFMNCPGSPPSGMNPTELAVILVEGCKNPAEVTPNQDSSSPAALSQSLTKNCNQQAHLSTYCLDAETGTSDLKNKTPLAAWKELLGDTIIVPIFCAEPTCDPSTVTGTGTGNVYPVYTFTAVTVCAYHIYDKASEKATTPDCTGSPVPDPKYPTDKYLKDLGCLNANDPCIPIYDADGNPIGFERPKDSVRLWLKYTRLVTGLAKPSGCALGDPCDRGIRGVTLIE